MSNESNKCNIKNDNERDDAEREKHVKKNIKNHLIFIHSHHIDIGGGFYPLREEFCLLKNQKSTVCDTSEENPKESENSSRRKKQKKELSERDEMYLKEHEKVKKIIMETLFNEDNEDFQKQLIESAQNEKSPMGAISLKQTLKGKFQAIQSVWNQYLKRMESIGSILCHSESCDVQSVEESFIFGRPIVNNSLTHFELTFLNEKFIIPPQSSFILSDLEDIQKCLEPSYEQFEILLMDPPWPNRSVLRSSMYDQIDIYHLFKIPMKQIANGLVCIWVTNNLKYIQFIKNKLFPDWGIEFITEWIWVKSDENGKFLWDLDSSHRKPYERLFIGCTCSNLERFQFQDLSPQVIVSVPSVVHSKKPLIHETLIQFYLNSMSDSSYSNNYKSNDHSTTSSSSESSIKESSQLKSLNCLELFSRQMKSGWRSWGNQSFLFNHQQLIGRTQVTP